MKKKYTLTKALFITLSVLGLAFSFSQNTLHARAAQDSSYFCETLDPDTEPVDYTL